MTALPLVAEAGIAAVLVLSMRRAFFGAEPQHPDGVAAAAWMLSSVMLLGTALAVSGEGFWRLALTVCGVEAACAAGWWLRAREDGGEGVEDAVGPTDWDEFDRLRGGWTRPREPVA